MKCVGIQLSIDRRLCACVGWADSSSRELHLCVGWRRSRAVRWPQYVLTPSARAPAYHAAENQKFPSASRWAGTAPCMGSQPRTETWPEPSARRDWWKFKTCAFWQRRARMKTPSEAPPTHIRLCRSHLSRSCAPSLWNKSATPSRVEVQRMEKETKHLNMKFNLS